MYSFIELLRAVAALLITNSHFDGVYPWNISWGGCPGLCLFFVITGFLLVRGVKGNFFPWWLKKVIRLYIPMTIVSIITVLLGMKSPSVSLFLFPITSTLWYVPAVSLLYIPYFIIIYLDKNGKTKKIPGGLRLPAICLATVIYFSVYIIRYRNEFFVEPEVGFRPIYGFIAMMLGSYIYDSREKIAASGKGLWFAIGAVLCCGGFILTRLLISRISLLLYVQFMAQVFSVAFAVLAMLAGLCYEEKIKAFMATPVGKVFGFISKTSLEIYLVQFAVIRSLKGLVFPVNFILIVAVIAICAFAVHFVSEKLTKAVNGLLFDRKKKENTGG